MKFGYRLKDFSLAMSLPSIVFLILPLAGFLLSPRATHTATTARAGWLTMIFFGVFFPLSSPLRCMSIGARVLGPE
ncbi:hypothetical protein [Cupriavidus sp. H18C1]|uniref:hypothetical protein n=1 Tax=Cupriavidus sp. H18C1 TaxID=3241601 RepID=UPI003BB8C9EB